MSRHHNTKHDERSPANYANRPGMMGTSGHLTAVEGNSGLRAKQERRIRATCTIGDNHDHHECNGVPFPAGTSVSEDDE